MKAFFFLCVVLSLLSPCRFQSISNYNVVWTTPSNDVSGSMPLGNGNTAANVWLEPQNNKLSLYIARQDAWDENASVLKLGRVDLIFSPGISTNNFNQTLDLLTSTVYISTSNIHISVWIDANSDNVIVQSQANVGQQFRLTVNSTIWRKTNVPLFSQNWYCGQLYTYPDVVVDPITILPQDTLVFYHRNEPSRSTFFSDSMKRQGLGNILNQVNDPLTNRQFGAAVYGSGLVRSSPTTLVSQNSQNSFTVVISTLSAQTTNSDQWLNQIKNTIISFNDLDARRKQHVQWWSSFWDRSHIFITSSPDTFTISQQYTIWRFLQACQGRASFPIKFNGQLYVAENALNPDNRDWGGANWWQNARLSYWNMFISGDSDLLPSLFEYYLNMLPMARLRTPIYFNISGAFFPETQTIFGNYYDSDYGCSRNSLPPEIPDTRWNRYNYQGGLDLSMLILDHYTYFQDDNALRRYLPIVTSVIEFYSGRWTQHDSNGKIIFFPSQSLETYQCPTYPPIPSDCVTNDLPDIAGLHAIVPRLIALPQGFLSSDFVSLCKNLLGRLPPIPTIQIESSTVFVAGEKLPSSTSNSENTELYVVHPYRNVVPATKQNAIATYNRRQFKCNQGWCQDILDAALLGLTSEAMNQVLERAKTGPAPGYRFPGFMPHFQDFEPSSDHLSNMNSALQWMLLQGDDSNNNILLFPSWPCDWDVDFKLRGPLNTIVEGKYSKGKLNQFTVTPATRTKNVQFAGCVQDSWNETIGV